MQPPWDDEPEPSPIDLLARFATCRNYPRHDPLAVQMLAQALAEIGARYQTKPKFIVNRWAEASPLCPTEYDLRVTAIAIRDDRVAAEQPQRDREQRQQWEREYGKPKPIAMDFTLPEKRRDDELWAALRKKFPGKWPSWDVLAKAARGLGYEDYARAWENAYGIRR